MSDILTEYKRGYKDGYEHRDESPLGPTRALNLFLDGLFGSRSEDDMREAYEKGYREGTNAASDEKRAVHVGGRSVVEEPAVMR